MGLEEGVVKQCKERDYGINQGVGIWFTFFVFDDAYHYIVKRVVIVLTHVKCTHSKKDCEYDVLLWVVGDTNQPTNNE